MDLTQTLWCLQSMTNLNPVDEVKGCHFVIIDMFNLRLEYLEVDLAPGFFEIRLQESISELSHRLATQMIFE